MAREGVPARGEAEFKKSVFPAEVDAINGRRSKQNPPRPEIDLPDDDGVLDAVGLALSGGGIRSAAVSLGVLQALNQHDVFRHIDYLSTVSGGGYAGAATTATMSKTNGEFVFGNIGGGGERNPHPPASDIKDTDAVGHIRNYSNYLIPFGARDVMTALAIIVRGLAANLGLLLPVVLLLAALTIFWNPTRDSLGHPELAAWLLSVLPSWLSWVPRLIPQMNFGVTLFVAFVELLLFFIWALARSFLPATKIAEFRTRLPAWAAWGLVILALVFFCEIQPFMIDSMFKAADTQTAGGLLTSVVASWIKRLAVIAAPIAAVVTFFRQQLGEFFKSTSASAGMGTALRRILAKAAVWIAGAALPLLIWVGYLYLCFWGVPNTTDAESHVPTWLGSSVAWLNAHIVGGPYTSPIAWLYLVVGAVLGILALGLRPNANSLHRLYRDRISKAFLFDPNATVRTNIARSGDFTPLDTMRLTELSTTLAPYQLINATLNVQGSDFANRRGRNADFFLFSQAFVGSYATGYAKTEILEKTEKSLDLATAIAISGAAVSSNMGGLSIRPLMPMLALLNIRLGYWLTNPRYANPNRKPPETPRHRLRNYLWSEITGRLYEDGDVVYVTDGGHIENLGVYELLRRRCELIVVVDVDGDAKMHFPSFMKLQRYARIDLGIRIDMPWDAIRKTTRNWMGLGSGDEAKPDPVATRGPHIAVGLIDYGLGQPGYIVYVKSSLTGDENDSIRDYARRNASFPHETTGDQFFNEEQFEVYRALAFHMMFGFLAGSDDVVAAAKFFPRLPLPSPPTGGARPAAEQSRVVPANDPALQPVRDLLGLKAP
jgi:hypothetical protein